jgi:uncharacterized delta-60 repeat protein
MGRPSGRRAARSLTAVTGSVLVTLALLLAAAPNAHAAPGDLDPTFSRNGKVLTDVGGGGDDGASAVAVQPDGGIVAAGFSSQPASGRTFAVVRYDSDGARDPSFGDDGIVTTAFGDGTAAARALAIEADGDIVVAGTSSQPETGWDIALARYEPDGSLDSAFGQNGRVTTDFDGASDGANAVVLQPDGKIVVAGESGGDFGLARYDTDGSLDTSFSGDGVLTTDFAGWGDVAYALALQGDGRIIAAGNAIQHDESIYDTRFFALARYQADGTADPSFSGDGIAITDISGSYNTHAYAIALQQDGRMVLGGRSYNGVLARYNADGSPDPSFGDAGRVLAYAVRALASQSNGTLVAAGSNPDFEVARWSSNGTLDRDFGQSSPLDSPGAETDFGDFNEDQARAVAIQSDGKIVAAGRSVSDYNGPGDFALARYRVDSLPPADADADGVENDEDLCDHRPATHPDGCPHYPRTVTIRYSNRDRAFKGRVYTDRFTCEWSARVAIFKHQPGDDLMVGRPYHGSRYVVPYPRRRGWYYAKVDRYMWGEFLICNGSRSTLLRVGE